jgi:sugar phosphate permease
VFSLLYAGNMYFQSYGAVAIVKVNAHWFHVRERGGFSGIFGTMISSGIFFAYTVNGWLLDLFTRGLEGSAKTLETRWVFLIPGMILLTMAVIETFILRDRPGQAGQQDFDTGDAASDSNVDLSSVQLMKKILTHPVILTVAFVEFCTGVLRNGIMSWYPIYAREVLALPSSHYLVNGSWGSLWTIVPFFVLAAALFIGGSQASGGTRRVLVSLGGVSFLVPFMQGGWGGILMVAGVIGGNVAGYISDLFFASRRAPAAGGLYATLCVCTVAMIFSLGKAENLLSSSSVPGLLAGDRILEIGRVQVHDWVSARRSFACVPAPCVGGAAWDETSCVCTSKGGKEIPASTPLIGVTVERGGQHVQLSIPDPAYRVDKAGNATPRLRAGDGRELKVTPTLTRTPYLLGAIVFLMSLCVIGTHGLLSGTATMDFGGKKGAATAVAMIDGFVYLGTGLQSLAIGKIATYDWAYWPVFLVPFAFLGTILLRRIWSVNSARQTAPG